MIARLLKYKKTIALLKTIFLTIISLILVKYFNFFSAISLIPDDDVFSFGITFYLSILEVTWQLISGIIQDKYISKINISLANSKKSKTDKEDVFCAFPTLDTAYIFGEIEIYCMPKSLRKMNILIVFPSWVIVQPNSIEDSVIEVIGPHVCKLNLSSLIDDEITERVISKYKFKLDLLKNVSESTDREDKVECRLEYTDTSMSNPLNEFVVNNRIFMKSN